MELLKMNYAATAKMSAKLDTLIEDFVGFRRRQEKINDGVDLAIRSLRSDVEKIKKHVPLEAVG
jgi:hypothetical protein